MVRKLLLLVVALGAFSAGIAKADDLAAGVKAWEARDYKQAHAIFSKLAAAGDTEAQRQLGEMYGFGDGVPEDMATAEKWVKQAMAGGNKDAAASLETLKQRSAHKADIDYYVNKYDGADVSLAKYGCKQPFIPAVSKGRDEVKAVSAGVTEWLNCYQRFAAGLAAATPAGKAIPENIANLMSTTEFDQAKARMDKVYTQQASAAKKQAVDLVAANDAWVKKSEEYARQEEKNLEYDIERRNQMSLGRAGSAPRASVGGH